MGPTRCVPGSDTTCGAAAGGGAPAAGTSCNNMYSPSIQETKVQIPTSQVVLSVGYSEASAFDPCSPAAAGQCLLWQVHCW